MGLIACRECKAEISDTASSCPKCGAKLPSSILKKVLIGIGVLVVLLVAILALTPETREQKAFNRSLDDLDRSIERVERASKK